MIKQEEEHMLIWRRTVKAEVLAKLQNTQQNRLDDLENDLDLPERQLGEDGDAVLGNWLTMAIAKNKLATTEYNELRKALHLKSEAPAIQKSEVA